MYQEDHFHLLLLLCPKTQEVCVCFHSECPLTERLKLGVAGNMLLHDPHGHAVSAPANSMVMVCPGSRDSLRVGEALLSTGYDINYTW